MANKMVLQLWLLRFHRAAGHPGLAFMRKTN